MQPYTKTFHEHMKEGALRSAREIVPLVLELIQPKRVVDVGCSTGAWLSVFKEHGVENILGVDGDYVDRGTLLIPEEQFLPLDLSKPFWIDGEFDLAISLEVAEHLPPECTGHFIDSLTRLAPVILFSAAIPFQGGIHHVNEQWPDYWAKLFQKRGYVAIDCIRGKIWQSDNVEWYYANNILMFARRDFVQNHPALVREFESTNASQLSIVHPKQYLKLNDPRSLSTKLVFRALPFAIIKVLKWAVRKLM